MSKVSVIIPTFNRPHLLPQAVESVHRAGRDIEVIVVDDASTDSTAEVCATLREIKYIRLDRNQGVAGARNVGLLESTGEFIAFLDDDDLRLPDSLDHQVSLLEANHEAGFVGSGVLLAAHDGVDTGKVAIPRGESGDIFWRVLGLDVHLIPGSVLLRKQCFLEIGLFNQKLAGIDDWDLWTRIAEVRSLLYDSVHSGRRVQRICECSNAALLLNCRSDFALVHQSRRLRNDAFTRSCTPINVEGRGHHCYSESLLVAAARR